MFIYAGIAQSVSGKITYIWNIEINDTIIGQMKLVVSGVGGSNLYAYLHRDKIMYLPQELLINIINNFKYLANEKLLDIEEEYRHFHYIEITYDDTINNYFQI
jgi:hypothetical protein